ncbi:hypothetical protein [Gemmatimonas sp.]|uniref:hypothetical protein n=1 Tax=Gemmatimonas sp. TaxID=1962908 RepID=UPI003983D62A
MAAARARRDTNSRFNLALGGRVLPGIFARANFAGSELPTSVALRIGRPDGGVEVTFAGRLASSLPAGSVFPTTDAAAGFFSLGATGYSATLDPSHYHGMELHSLNWTVSPLEIDDAACCFFDDRSRFPAGTVELDCALLMRGLEHEWRRRPDLYATADGPSLTVHRA